MLLASGSWPNYSVEIRPAGVLDIVEVLLITGWIVVRRLGLRGLLPLLVIRPPILPLILLCLGVHRTTCVSYIKSESATAVIHPMLRIRLASRGTN